ncbi:hypothetical protein ACFRH6_11195 [Streptomyces sp. NPDC056749]|uniref:hypothetical protein n=1 Tax=Streptomyces sp. NPDC056749 TaxID=3345936 RepID=UPI0036C386AB
MLSASVQALMVMRLARNSPAAGESGQYGAVTNRVARLGLAVSAVVALWVAMEHGGRETRTWGPLSYSALRDEVDTMFFRLVFFAFDITTYVILFFPTTELLAVGITTLLFGHPGRKQAVGLITTVTTTTTAAVLIFVAKTRIEGPFHAPWIWVVMSAIGGVMLALEFLAGEPSGGGDPPDTTTHPDASESFGQSTGERAHQSPGRGRVLTFLGWTLLAPALPLALIGSTLYGDLVPEAGLPLWLEPLIAAGVVIPPFLLLMTGAALLKRGRHHRHRVVPSLEALIGERYLLYLRPFAIDPALALPPEEAPGWFTRSPFELTGTHEEFLIRQFRHLGRIVAIGQPGEPLPALGAERGYLPAADWKDTVSKLIQGAHAVIMTAAPGPGTAWEYVEALRTTTPARLLLLVYEDELYRAFQEGAAQEYSARSTTETGINWPPMPRLPDIPPPDPQAKGLRWDFPLKGILSFDRQWCPRFTRFPPTVPRMRHVWVIRRLVRRELKPALGPVSRLPPASTPRRNA